RRYLVEHHSLGLELGQGFRAHFAADIALVVARFLAGILQDLPFIAAKLIPEFPSDQDYDGPIDVPSSTQNLFE
ncbi:MAG TPA: hypothetical protein VFY87_26595, partial [Geminicoccaceae bacterium]|nr:hypothetical protein [Geminicoccaceae bacterium]